MSNIQIDLGPVVRQVQSMGDQLGRQIHDVSLSVGAVQNDVRTTSTELAALRAEFDQYVKQAELTANLQRSETKLSGLKDDLERAYGHHGIVRRTSIGLLQAFDVGIVTNAVAAQVSEELMIQTPQYWLAPALVALAGWSKDDHELADRSIAEAFRRDRRKTALFFALVLRRQQRVASSVRWLRHYLQGLDPARLGREFAIVFEAAAQGAFGPEGTDLLYTQLRTWLESLRGDETVVDAQVTKWQSYIEVQRQKLGDDEFPALRAVSGDWTSIHWLLEAASAVPAALDALTAVREKTDARPAFAEDLLDDLLEQLVTDYDEDELPLRRDISFHEAVIEETGDLDRARVRADLALQSLEETHDAVSLQTLIAIEPELLGVGSRTQQLAVGAVRDDIRAAVGRYTRDYRGRIVHTAHIDLRPDHSPYATTYGFPTGWQTTTDEAEQTVITRIQSTWADTFASYIEALRVRGSRFVVPAIIGAVVTLIAFFINPIAGIVALLGAGAVVFFMVNRARTDAQQKITQLEQVRGEAVATSVRLYRAASAEWIDAGALFDELDGRETELLALIDSWPAGRLTERSIA